MSLTSSAAKAKPVASPVVNASPSAGPVSVAVVVTCHEKYLPFLPACLMAINGQVEVNGQGSTVNGGNASFHLVQKILVLDGCAFPVMPCVHGWQVITGEWGDPNAARNAALDCVMAEWVTYWDADNQMPLGYLSQMAEVISPRRAQRGTEGMQGVGFVYPSVMRATAGGWAMGFLEAPAFDYWAVRERSVVDTSSFWRVRALKSFRWLEGIPCRDDHAVVLRLTRAGWKGLRADGVCVLLQAHGANRCQVGRASETLWKARSLAVVTLVSGSDYFFKVHDTFMRDAWPADTQFYWVDDTCGGRMASRQGSRVKGQREDEEEGGGRGVGAFKKSLMVCAEMLREKGHGVHIIEAPANYWPADAFWSKHGRVADLYNAVLPGLREDIVLTVEDDVAPMWGAARSLCEALTGNNGIAAVAGVYEARNVPGRACVSMHPEVWKDLPLLKELPSEGLRPVGMVAGGCTAWANWALQKALPMTVTTDVKLGWDGTVCRALRAMGYEFRLNCWVRCAHLCVEE